MSSRALIALGQEFPVASGASRGETLTVLMLALVAVALRAYHIGTESLWLDEAASVWIASRPLATVLTGELTNPPLYYLLLHFWIGVFGNTEAAIRWLSVGPSVAAIVVSYVVARRLYGHPTAIVAAGLMAVSPYQIYYAQEARAFALLLFLSLCSTLFFHMALTRPSECSSFGPWLAYGVTTIAALHTHFHAVFMLAAQHAIFVVFWRGHRGRLRGWLAVQAIVVTTFTPWLLTMLEAAGTVGGQIRRYLPLKLPEAIASFLVGDTLIPFDEAAVLSVRETLESNAHLVLGFTVAFGIYLLSAVRGAACRASATLFCAVMGVVPVLLPFIISFKVMVFDRRYVIGASPFVYILVAAGVLHLQGLALRRWRPAMFAHGVAGLLVILLLSVSLYNYYFNARFGKEQWRDVVRVVETSYAPGDIIVFDPGYLSVSYDYYSRYSVSTLALAADVRNEHGPGWRSAADILESHRRVWLVRSHLFTEPVLRRLEGTFTRVWHQHFPKAKGIDVYLLAR